MTIPESNYDGLCIRPWGFNSIRSEPSSLIIVINAAILVCVYELRILQANLTWHLASIPYINITYVNKQGLLQIFDLQKVWTKRGITKQFLTGNLNDSNLPKLVCIIEACRTCTDPQGIIYTDCRLDSHNSKEGKCVIAYQI